MSIDVRKWRWVYLVLVLLLTWGLRLCCLEGVPPGWRDDELINIHALSARLLRGELPIYYLGASGHEPLYHHLHAGVHAVLGFNVLSGHILSVAFGMLSIALTYSVICRLFPQAPAAAVVATLTLSTSFWSLMYSRTAIRHISLPPFVLATVYTLWRRLDAEETPYWSWIPVGLLLGGSIYTYTASRLLPVLIIGFLGYLALCHRDRLRGQWRGIVVAFVVTLVVVSPLASAIVQGRTRRAIEGIGADARVTELANPLRALRDGDAKPLVTSTVKTLGMFHASGDPEWLYNIPGRSVFGPLSGMLLWIGVALCLCRWRQPSCFLLLLWLALGLSPAFISTPPASLSHTIFAQPVAYILPALALIEMARWVRRRHGRRAKGVLGATWFLSAAVNVIIVAFVVNNAVRDVRDYFVVWPERGMVRFLYRADQREVADYLDLHPEIMDVAIGSNLIGPWDRISLNVDIQREGVVPRLFNPERALLWPAGEDSPPVLLPSWPTPVEPIVSFLGPGEGVSAHVMLYAPSPMTNSSSLITETKFANGLTLSQVQWLPEGTTPTEREAHLLTVWRVSQPLDLPPMPVVAQPPPPGTYNGPRLAVFAHLIDVDGQALSIDDGLWVDPLTLQPGDSFVQIHEFTVPPDVSLDTRALELGLYDPMTDHRWETLEGDGDPGVDLVHIPLGK